MKQIRLFIEGVEVQLDESVDFALNRYFEDTSKPTDKYIEFSKTVSVPFSLSNNRLFGSIYEPDRIITKDNSGDFTGIHFDPYRKLAMRLQDGDDVLMSGYAKMLSVDWDGEKGTYSLNLYGELGKIFGELSKVTFDNTNIEQDTQDYFIDGGQYYRETMNRQLIYDSWNSNRTYRPLVKTTDINYKPYNIVGWTPLNIRYDSDTLDQKSFELGDGKTKTFTEVLEQLTNPTFVDATKCNPDTAIGDGLMPRDIGEWRCYLQQPFMYFDKLMQLMNEKCKLLTGYEFWLDSNWFSSDNPFYDKAVFTLKNFENDVKDDIETDSAICTISGIYRYNSTDDVYRPLPSTKYSSGIYATQNGRLGLATANSNVINIRNSVNGTFSIPIKVIMSLLNADKKISVKISSECALVVELKVVGKNGDTLNYKNAFTSDTPLFDTTGYDSVKDVGSTSTGEFNFTADYNFSMFQSLMGDTATVTATAYWRMPGAIYTPFISATTDATHTANTTRIWPSFFTTGMPDNSDLNLKLRENNTRSYSTIALNDLWNNDVSPFDVIMQYCKMFRIGIFTDDVNKQVKFIPYSTYFSQYEILDWSDKLNKSVDYQIKPITYENKWVKFNYEDNSTKLNEKYKKQFGVQFGEYKIDTHYVFNNETEGLFEDIKCPMENTDNVLSWTNLYDNRRIVYSFPAEKYIYSKDDSGKLQDNFGTFYFDNGIVDFDTEDRLHLRKNIITDDSQNMIDSSKYVYNQYGDRTRTYKYHQLGTFIGKYMMTFTVPSYTFCYQDYAGKTGLYETFWKNYLQERYDVQNKIVTCYLNLKNSDWTNFEFNKFIKINNQLYFVNKIFDYNPASGEPVKCELITIQNILGYTKDNYNPYLSIAPETGTILRNNGSFDVNVEATQVVYVTSSVPAYTKIDGHTLSNATPQEIYEGNHTITTSGVPAGTNSVVITFRSGTYTKTLTLTIPTHFELYKYDASAIGGRGYKIEDNSTITMEANDYDTWLLVSSADWTWQDVTGGLQGFYINNVENSGSGQANTIGETLDIETRQMQVQQNGRLQFLNSDNEEINVLIEIV